MALTSLILKPVAEPTPVAKETNVDSGMASLLSAIVLTVYAGAKSRKQLRRLKRKAAWMLVKEKVRSTFSKNATDRQTLIYVLLGVAILALIFVAPVFALVLAIIGLILILTGTI